MKGIYVVEKEETTVADPDLKFGACATYPQVSWKS
jgi:hypothetical protein